MRNLDGAFRHAQNNHTALQVIDGIDLDPNDTPAERGADSDEGSWNTLFSGDRGSVLNATTAETGLAVNVAGGNHGSSMFDQDYNPHTIQQALMARQDYFMESARPWASTRWTTTKAASRFGWSATSATWVPTARTLKRALRRQRRLEMKWRPFTCS